MSLQAIRQLNIDFHDTRYVSINAKQYDRFSRFILVTCCLHGSALSIDKNNNYAFVRYRKPDELGVFNSCEITNDGKILIELSEQMLSVVGRSYADLIIVHNETTGDISVDKNTGELIIDNDSSILSTMNFYVNVIEDSFKNTTIESSYEYEALNDLLLDATTDYTRIINTCQGLMDDMQVIEENAKTSELNAATSEENAKISETNAKTSELNAKESETNASTSEANALASEEKALTYQNTTITHASEVHNTYVRTISLANSSKKYANLSESYAIGGTDSRTGEDTDNSKYYYLQAKAVSDSIDGSLIPMGTVSFEQLQTVSKETGYMYHINNDFITDDTFKSGTGISYVAGTNVYYTADGYWDCLVGQVFTIDVFEALSQTVKALEERIKALEEQTVLGITE